MISLPFKDTCPISTFSLRGIDINRLVSTAALGSEIGRAGIWGADGGAWGVSMGRSMLSGIIPPRVVGRSRSSRFNSITSSS